MRSPKTYFVYIMTTRSKTLYTGVTNNLIRRVREHKIETGSSFTAKYKIDRLVYFRLMTSSGKKYLPAGTPQANVSNPQLVQTIRQVQMQPLSDDSY